MEYLPLKTVDTMKMPQIVVWLLALFASFGLASCSEEPTSPDENSALLYPQSSEMNIIQRLSPEGQVLFELSEPGIQLAFIGIFDSPPEVEDGVLISEEDLIWEWFGEVGPNSEIHLEEGNLLDSTLAFSPVFFQCDSSDYFWAAWGWDDTAQYITHSTPKSQALFVPGEKPELRLLETTKVGAAPNDTLLVPGAGINLRFVFENIGDAKAIDPVVRIANSSISEFPVTLALDELDIGASASQTVNFTIPPDFSFADTLVLQIEMLYNNCLSSQTEVSLVVNALSVCITDVKLIDIRYLPPSILWDPLALPIFYPPDIYYEVIGPGETQMYLSSVIQDADDDFPNTPVMGDWPDLTPCLSLSLDSTYVIKFWDDDLDNDDYIGTYSFKPADFLSTQQELIEVTNDEIQMELYLNWE